MTIRHLYPAVEPSLNLDFANSRKLDSRITFTRGSTATYTDESGIIRTAAANEARFDHDPTTGESLGLLVEESRQNLLLQSEDFSTTWTTNQTSITANVINSPLGTATADLVTVSSDGSSRSIFQAVSGLTVSAAYTLSIYVKAGSANTATIGLLSSGWRGLYTFTLTGSGSVTPVIAGVNASIISVGDGWYRCVINVTSDVTVLTSFVYPKSSGTVVAGDSVYLWGAQLEAGSFPTSYIPTSGSTATRSADVASMTGTNFSSWFNSTQGTLFVDHLTSNDYGYGYNLINSSVGIGGDNIFNYGLGSGVRSGGVLLQVSHASALSIKQALSYDSTGISVSRNSVLSTQSGSLPLPSTINELTIGTRSDLSANYYISKPVARLTYYPTRLSDAILQNLTT
jgi:hypothetical protein